MIKAEVHMRQQKDGSWEMHVTHYDRAEAKEIAETTRGLLPSGITGPVPVVFHIRPKLWLKFSTPTYSVLEFGFWMGTTFALGVVVGVMS